MLSFDYETYCDIDIRKVGLDAYTSHPSFEVLMMAYRLDDGPLQHWQAHLEPFPQEVRERLLCPTEVKWAYNSAFERVVTRRGLGIDTPVEGWRCAMVLAYMRSFTGSLADVGNQMMLPADVQKQKIGGRLIRKFCMPQRITRNQQHVRRDYNTDPDDWQLFVEYNLNDVLAEEAVRDRLLYYPTLEDEWQFYSLDQRINDRGMPFDRQFAINVRSLSERRREELLDEMRGLTGVENPNSQVQLLGWLRSQGYPFDDIGGPTMRRALNLYETGELNLPPICVEVMKLREWSGKTATKKADTAVRSAGEDDRIRYMFQFAGASRTARFCLAEGSPVLVRDAQGRIRNLPIEQVTAAYQVWDGNAWVSNDGAVFSGIKEVILYDGILATAEHGVYISDDLKLPLGDAARAGLRLWRGSRDDYVVYNLSGDFTVRSLLYRDDQSAVERAVEGASSAFYKRGLDIQAPVLCGDKEIRRGEFPSGSVGKLYVFRGSAGCRDTTYRRTSAEGASLQYIARGRGYTNCTCPAQGIVDESGLGDRVSCEVVGWDQKQRSSEGASCNPSGAGCGVAGAESGGGAEVKSEGAGSSATVARPEPGKISRDTCAGFQGMARAESREGAQSCRGGWQKNQAKVASDVIRRARTTLRKETSECDAAMGGLSRGRQEDDSQEDRQIAENSQCWADAGTARNGRGAVGESSREYRSRISEAATEGSFTGVLDTGTSCRVFRKATKKTYDIINAGPRNRFLVSGRIVSNSGRLVQPQNMQRTPKLFDPEHDSTRLDVVTDLIRQGDYETFDLMVEEPMMVFGGTMRGMFRASPGHVLHVCDYSSIESVGLGWAAGCDRILQIFRDKRDFYRDFGTSLYRKPYEAITSAERQVCKSACLGCGYGLGPGKVLEDGRMTGLLAYAANMGIEMDPEQAVAAVSAYRDAYHEVVAFWWACQDAVQSVLEEGGEVAVGPFVFSQRKPFLLIRLPSGRHIYYYKPRMEMREVRTGKKKWDGDRMVDEIFTRNVFTYMGRNQATTQWDRIVGRGSSLVENIVQALTRDILKIGMIRLDAKGFNIIGHSHDEIIVESRQGSNRTWEAMREIMIQPIAWLPDFPLGASGFSSVYYRK